MTTPAEFPILWCCSVGQKRKWLELHCPTTVPWSLVAPHEEQALANHSQTLKRLAERGGLSPAELVAVLQDRPFRFKGELSDEEAIPILAGYEPPAPPALVHSRGLPNFGPPTLCGEGKPDTRAMYEVTCPRCNAIHAGGAAGLMARIQEIQVRHIEEMAKISTVPVGEDEG